MQAPGAYNFSPVRGAWSGCRRADAARHLPTFHGVVRRSERAAAAAQRPRGVISRRRAAVSANSFDGAGSPCEASKHSKRRGQHCDACVAGTGWWTAQPGCGGGPGSAAQVCTSLQLTVMLNSYGRLSVLPAQQPRCLSFCSATCTCHGRVTNESSNLLRKSMQVLAAPCRKCRSIVGARGTFGPLLAIYVLSAHWQAR